MESLVMSHESGPGPGEEGATRLLTGLVILLGGAAAAGALWWSAISHTRPPEMPDWTPPTAVRVQPGEDRRYVGAVSCRECHPGESAEFVRSGHARTLRPAEKDPIARQLDGRTVADPERTGVAWTYHFRDGRLSVDRREGGQSETLPIEFSFGSGQVGTTFVTTMKPGPGSPPIGLEHRLSYLAAGRKLAITPGQQKDASPEPGSRITPSGRILGAPLLLRCFSCHVTTTSREGHERLDTAAMVPNVSCERCHGPASAHIDAARRGGSEEELRMPMGLDEVSPRDQLAACG